MQQLFTIFIALFLIYGCVSTQAKYSGERPTDAKVTDISGTTYKDIAWEGNVHITKPITMTKKTTLTIYPGTNLYVECAPPEGSDVAVPSYLQLFGRVIAIGKDDSPIRIIQASANCRDDSSLISVVNNYEAIFLNTHFVGGDVVFNANSSNLRLEHCSFSKGNKGVVITGGRLELVDNIFRENRVGLNISDLDSPKIERNQFVNNFVGLLISNDVTNVVLRSNYFKNDNTDLELGAHQLEQVDARKNWWGNTAKTHLSTLVIDGMDREGTGKVLLEPMLSLRSWKPLGQ